ncbi:MAG: hypothetical protein M3Z36_05385 [Acidobacteriota bacterium]|nr:hypothetical protein [Acidobacteriota bacterium]
MTVYAPFHPYGLLELHGLLLHQVAVAALAFDLGSRVLAMAEEYKVGHFVDALGGNLPLGHIDVAHFALRDRREASEVPARGLLMAGDTLQL